MPCKKPVWYVYILLCRGDFLYTGISTDPARRFKQHLNKSAKFTSYNPPLEIVYTRRAANRSQALKREAAIKKFSKKAKLALIASAKK